MNKKVLNNYWKLKLLDVWQEEDVELFEKWLRDNFIDIEDAALLKEKTEVRSN